MRPEPPQEDTRPTAAVPAELRGVKWDPRLFTPVNVGAVRCANRIFMAPLTRLKADRNRILPPFAIDYYTQRAGAGLIVTEATGVCPTASGCDGAPDIWSKEQTQMWKRITDAVHAKGGKICVQLWHTGRVSHPQVIGRTPMSSSAVKPKDVRTTLLDDNRVPSRAECPVPAEMTPGEIREVVNAFAQATRNAREAGFDLVELHGAHGYLHHQFYCPNSNLRMDEYGGSIEKRCRFILETLDAMCEAWSNDRVGIRFSPLDDWQDCNAGPVDEAMRNALYLVDQLAKRNPAYLSLSEGFGGPFTPWPDHFRGQIRHRFPGCLIVNGDYDNDKARRVIFEGGYADVLMLGRRFIHNPDLVHRMRIGADLNAPENLGVYGGGAQGYSTYSALPQ